MNGSHLALRATAPLWLAAALLLPLPAASETPRLTLDRLYSLPSLIGTAPTGFAWSDDGRLAFLWNDEGYNRRDVWVVDAAAPDREPVRWTRLAPAVGPRANADPVEKARIAEAREREPGATRVVWHPDGRRLLIFWRSDLWLVEKGAKPVRLTSSGTAERAPAFSPAGDTLAFLREGNLWTLAAEGAEPLQRTWLAAPDVSVGSFRWSPDGKRIALLEVDKSAAPLRAIPDYLTDEPTLDLVRRPYPGEEPFAYRLGVLALAEGGAEKGAGEAADAAESAEGAAEQVDEATGEPTGKRGAEESDIRWLDLGVVDGVQPALIHDYRWSPDGRRLAVDTSDLYAKDRRVLVIDLAEEPPAVALVARDRDPENETFYFWSIAWSTDGKRLYFLSDREEDYHVWVVTPRQSAMPPSARRRLTSGPWAVAAMHPVEGGLVVVGNRGRPEERQLFFVGDEGGEPRRLSVRPGTHEPVVSPDGRWAAVAFSSDDTPPELLLTSLAGEGEHRVTHSPLPEFSEYAWVTPEYVEFPSHVDGTTLHGRLTRPPDFDPERTYPAILGSVYTDSVRNQWGGRTAHPTWGLDQFLAQEGYVLLNVDMRGSWGRGREHRRGIRLDYGGMDIEDLESGVRYLATLGYVDRERVGIWGSSYGGLMTAMSLFRKPGLYAAGIAGAPATNVGHALTGQMAVMMRPEDQPEEYVDSSPVFHAHGLEDPLMIVHGMRDRVVLFQDSVRLVQRLIDVGKDVDLVALPDAGHGWDNEGLAQTRFAFKKMVDFFDRHLKPD